jgi:peptidylprolyl isomerase domain and WD repeat-containing protein 1
MINIIKLGFTPHACCWVHRKGLAQALLAVFVYLIYVLTTEPLTSFIGQTQLQERYTFTMVEVVTCLLIPLTLSTDSLFISWRLVPPLQCNYAEGLTSVQYSDKYDTVISADEGGFVEYWQPSEPWGMPKNLPGLWSYKSSTDLYEFKKVSRYP